MTGSVLRVGTRGSALAMTQSRQVARAIAEPLGCPIELVQIRTEGDINTGPLATIGGTGVFVTAVREALLRGAVDLVVHSFKDLPTAPADGIKLGAVPQRESVSDALCDRDSRTLAQLPPGARVGTGSPRRRAQLLAIRGDLELVGIRGNIDTRLSRASADDLDAVILASAGLRRLGRADAISDEFDPQVFLPAPAQGALAVECRADETPWFAAGLTSVDDPFSRWAAIAERAVLARLEAGCSAPVSAWARTDLRTHQPDADARLELHAQVTATDGRAMLREQLAARVSSSSDAAELGDQVAQRLLAAGASQLLDPPGTQT